MTCVSASGCTTKKYWPAAWSFRLSVANTLAAGSRLFDLLRQIGRRIRLSSANVRVPAAGLLVRVTEELDVPWPTVVKRNHCSLKSTGVPVLKTTAHPC